MRSVFLVLRQLLTCSLHLPPAAVAGATPTKLLCNLVGRQRTGVRVAPRPLMIIKKRVEINLLSFLWSEWGDSNARPLGPEPSTLPTALHPDNEQSLHNTNHYFTIISIFWDLASVFWKIFFKSAFCLFPEARNPLAFARGFRRLSKKAPTTENK